MDVARLQAVGVSHALSFGRESADGSEGPPLPWSGRGTSGETCKLGGGGGLTALRQAYRLELESQRLSASVIRQRLMLFDRLGDPRTATRSDVLRILEPFDGGTRQVYLSAIRRIYEDLAYMGAVEVDASRGVRRQPPKRYEPRPVTEEQLRRIMDVGGRIREWAVMGAYAGLRRFEVLQVEPAHLLEDDRGPTLLVPNGKGGTRLTIPAHPLVVEVLRSHGPGRCWPMATRGFDKAWRIAMDGIGLPDVTFHRLRHRFATSVYQATGDLLLTSKVCRHGSVKTTQVYAQVADRRPYDAVMAI